MATRKQTGTSSGTARDDQAESPFRMPTLDDLKDLTERFKVPGVDMAALADWQRKELETLAEAQRQAYEGFKAIVERRNEILRETLAQWQTAMTDVSGKDVLTRQSDAAKRGVEKAIENFRELSSMEAEARNRTWKVLQDRMQENMANLQHVLQPKK